MSDRTSSTVFSGSFPTYRRTALSSLRQMLSLLFTSTLLSACSMQLLAWLHSSRDSNVLAFQYSATSRSSPLSWGSCASSWRSASAYSASSMSCIAGRKRGSSSRSKLIVPPDLQLLRPDQTVAANSFAWWDHEIGDLLISFEQLF